MRVWCATVAAEVEPIIHSDYKYKLIHISIIMRVAMAIESALLDLAEISRNLLCFPDFLFTFFTPWSYDKSIFIQSKVQ